MKPSELKSFLTFAIANKFATLIKGMPGIGKSDIIEQVAKELDTDFILSHPVVSDPTDYKGLPFADAKSNVAKFLPFGELQQLITATKPTVYFLDDLGQAPASVQAACMQLLLARRINGHKVSDNVTFIAATNRREDKAGVSGLLEPVKSRVIIQDLDIDRDEWCEWALANNIPTELIAFIRFKPSMLSDFKPSKDIVNGPCPRTVAKCGQMQSAGLPKELEFESFKGAAGEGFAVEYCAFLKLFRDLPSFEEIVMNPKSAPISQEPSTQYAISGLLSGRMSDTNIESCVTYLERLKNKEIEVCTIKYAAKRDPQVMRTRTYNAWATKNAKLFI